MNVIEVEKPVGVIVQLGGQTPLKLARALHEAGVPIMGTSFDDIDRAENRRRFADLVEELGLLQPASATATSRDDAFVVAERLGYPVLVRPSYVLGGRGMRTVYDRDDLARVLDGGVALSADEPLLLDKFLEDAIEVDVDALGDGTDFVVAAVMEHIEEAGIHSGDSSCVVPPYLVAQRHLDIMRDHTRRIASVLKMLPKMRESMIVAPMRGSPCWVKIRVGECAQPDAAPRLSQSTIARPMSKRPGRLPVTNMYATGACIVAGLDGVLRAQRRAL